MTATGWKGGTYGVRVGKRNAVRYFSTHWKNISVEIDGHFYNFNLSEKFWTTCPEFRGNPIKQWFLGQGLALWPYRKPPELALAHVGENRFRLSVK